jgi:disulfide bond formation protein DsbB
MHKLTTFWQQYGAYLALAPALTAMLGSLYYSEIAGFVPCTLCWYQRILMYPLSLIILIGIFKQDEYFPSYVLPFSIIGMGVSAYHYLIQLGVFSHPATCNVGIPCNLRWVNYFGFVTIPFMALTAFIMITVIMAATQWAYSRMNTVVTES